VLQLIDNVDTQRILFAERPPSGIAGWRIGLIAENGSEGARDALLPASPVPERRATVASARKLERPAINCTALFAFLLLCIGF